MTIEINKIYNENCIDIMAKMPDNFIDLTVTSPPYDNLREYKNNIGNEWAFDKFKTIALELFRVTKSGCVVVWVVGDATVNGSETGTSFKQALFFKEIGFNLHDTMIYEKSGLTFPEINRYYQKFEYMFILSKRKPTKVCLLNDRVNRTANQIVNGCERQINGKLTKKHGMNWRRIKEYGVRFNIWQYKTGWNLSYNEEFLKGHPAIFPEKLAEDHILSWSNKGDLVFDPFTGSGTTLKMAILNERNFIGSEISKEYCEIAQKRISKAQEKQEFLNI